MKTDSKILFLAVAVVAAHSIAQVGLSPAYAQNPQAIPVQAPQNYQQPNQPLPTSPTMAPLDSSAQPLPDQSLTRTVPGIDNSDLPLSDQTLSDPSHPGMNHLPAAGTSGWFNIQPGARSMNDVMEQPQVYRQQQNPQPQIPAQQQLPLER